MASSSCEEEDDFGLLGDGDGDGKGKAKAKPQTNPDHDSHSNHHHHSHHQRGEKRKEDPVDLTFAPVVVKKRTNASSAGSDVYRKDREEWSDGAIEALLDAYTQRFELLNRGNLRGRDWEDVAAAVNANAGNGSGSGNGTGNKGNNGKTVEQCKNKIDNLKKRFKVECNRISSSSGLSASHWPWYAKLHLIVSNPSLGSPRDQSQSQTASPVPNSFAIPIQAAPVEDEDGSASASGSAPPPPSLGKQSKRYAAAAAGAAPMRVFPGPRCKWKRVLLKVSGAALTAPPASGPHNVDPKVVMLIAREIQVATRQGVQVAVVVGGRNIFCGDSWIAATAVDRASTYQICMMASVMNAMLLQASLEKIGVATRVQTNLSIQEAAEPYIRRKAISHLDKGRVVIFGGIASGLGNPLFTTDAAAALRASEINADAVLKGTTGDALYGCHPGSNNSASFEHISYREFVSRGFTPMDTTAVAFCEENNIPVILFNLLEPSNISRALAGDQIGTLIDQSGQIG